MGNGLSGGDVSSMPVFTVRGRLYRVLDTIGQGSEATVYRCEDQTAAQHAVKVFYFSNYPQNQLRRHVAKFNKEARILKYLNKRSRRFIHLVDYEYKPSENTGYMIMELGENSLRNHLVGAPLDQATQRMIWKQIVGILKDLQDASVVHADIKPDNLIFVNNVLKLTDLGLAFHMSRPRHAIQRLRVRGTLDYMAPEVFLHQTGFKSDIWSAGIILYEMSYGRPPYFSIVDRNQKVAAITSMSSIPFPQLRNSYLLDIMKRCLHFNSYARPNAYEILAHPYTRM